MKSTLIFLVGMPLLAALAAASLRRGAILTLAASVAGEVLGLFLYARYNGWRVTTILSGKASGSVVYVGTDAPRQRVVTFLVFCALGCLIGLLVLFLRRVRHYYRREIA